MVADMREIRAIVNVAGLGSQSEERPLLAGTGR